MVSKSLVGMLTTYIDLHCKIIVICKPPTLNDDGWRLGSIQKTQKARFLAATILLFISKSARPIITQWPPWVVWKTFFLDEMRLAIVHSRIKKAKSSFGQQYTLKLIAHSTFLFALCLFVCSSYLKHLWSIRIIPNQFFLLLFVSLFRFSFLLTTRNWKNWKRVVCLFVCCLIVS